MASVTFAQYEWISVIVWPNFLLSQILLIIWSLFNLSNIPSPKIYNTIKIYFLQPSKRKSLFPSTLIRFIQGSGISPPMNPPKAGNLT